MHETQDCPQCGAPITVDAPGRLCPACLMRIGMEATAASEDERHTSMEVTTDFVAGASSTSNAGGDQQDLPRVGETFGGYRLLSVLGQGGMGAVFEAEELETGRIVALKLLKQAIRDRDGRKRFFREGRLAASLNHPNSVYVFGTEEIDGTPAISMERVVGGTLADRVRVEGPMPIAEAVDAILQVIDGLEAAADVGVLHRDIKPSNCFVDESGAVKIGDFGLSVSTSGRGDSHLTVEGSFLGTPAFASPEQLRGEELDVRSDIYAVGVTLFYLLTGRTPHEADNMVKLLATVLEQAPPSPRELRPETPRRLAHAVLRCLAKQPGSRFRTYADLRKALTPYGSGAPTAAGIGLRTLAGFLDIVPLTLAIIYINPGSDLMVDGVARLAASGGTVLPWQLVAQLVVWTLSIYYYALPEGLVGASPGKAICRLRVVDAEGRPFGIGRAALRAACFSFGPTLPCIVTWAVIASRVGARGYEGEVFASMGPGEWLAGALASLSVYALIGAFFLTARRANGYAALHDLATRSRVVRTRGAKAWTNRPRLEVEEESTSEPDGLPKLGAYHVLRQLESSAGRPTWLAYDTRLLRRVWIRETPIDEIDPNDKKINVARRGRQRWIGSWTEGERRFVVYEALTGKPFLEVTAEAQPWASVRYWLHDLAAELSAAEADGTLPATLSVDRVWITADGRLKLLDFPPPGVEPLGGEASPTEFLLTVAARALHWKPRLAARDPDGAFLPVGVLESVQPLAEQSIGDAAENLAGIEPSKDRVSRMTRLAMLLVLLPHFFLGFSLTFPATEAAFEAAHRNSLFKELGPLRDNLAALASVDAETAPEADSPDSGPTRQDWEAYIAYHYLFVVEDEIVWGSEKANAWIPEEHRAIAERAVERGYASYPEWQGALAKVAPLAPSKPRPIDPHGWKPRRMAEMSVTLFVSWLLLITMPCGLVTLLDRRGPVVRVFGVDYVTEAGTKAHRLHLMARHCFPPLAFVAAVCLGQYLFSLANAPYFEGNSVNQWSLVLSVGVTLGVTAVSSVLKQRGLVDRLAGVYPVPH